MQRYSSVRVCLFITVFSKADNVSKTTSHCLSLLDAVSLRAGATSRFLSSGSMFWSFHRQQCPSAYQTSPPWGFICVNAETRFFWGTSIDDWGSEIQSTLDTTYIRVILLVCHTEMLTMTLPLVFYVSEQLYCHFT